MSSFITFLKKLQKNNKTEWMHAHKDEYLKARAEFEFLVQEMIARLSVWDEDLPLLEVKDCTFRINRDIRFSDDKRPYKENFAAYVGYDGKKGHLPGYYLHVSPKEVFAAGGLWHPEPEHLLKVRRAIAENGDELVKILGDKKFKKTFGKLDSSEGLKRVPKGFDPDHAYADLLKLKSFVVRKNFSVTEVTEKGFGKKVDEVFKTLKPLNDFLRRGM